MSDIFEDTLKAVLESAKPHTPFWYPSGMPSAEDLDAVAEEEKARERTK